MRSAAGSRDYRVVLGLTSGEVSGVDVFSANLARGLNARGVPTRIVLTSPERRASFSWSNPLQLPADVPTDRLEYGSFESWRSRWARMAKYLEDQAPCIYVPNYDYLYSCVSPRLSAGVAIVGIVHSDDPDHYDHVSRLGRYWNAVVAVSGAIAGRTREIAPSTRDRLVVLPYGVSVPPKAPERPDDRNRPLRAVYAGRLVQHQKRVLDLAGIFERLTRTGAPIELTVVGNGADAAEMKRMCETRIRPGIVRFLGTLPNDRVLETFETSDAVILTSAFEGLPVCLLEAMSRGCVPVVSDIRSGIPELVRDGENGYVVPIGDLDGFADRLTRLQKNPDLRREMSLRAHRTIADSGYDLCEVTERYIDLFDRVRLEARTGRWIRPSGSVVRPPGLSRWQALTLPAPFSHFAWATSRRSASSTNG